MRLLPEEIPITIVRSQPGAFQTKSIATVAGPVMSPRMLNQAQALGQGFDILLTIQSQAIVMNKAARGAPMALPCLSFKP